MVKKRVLFLDGEFLPAEPSLEAHLAPTKVGGSGVFETMLSERGKIFFLREHLARLSKGAAYFKIKLPFSTDKMASFVKRLVRLNHHYPARIRLLVWKDQGMVHVAMTAAAYKVLSRKKYRTGLTAVIVPPRCGTGSRTAEVKSLDYQPYSRAYQQAAAKGYEEALLLNTAGELAEGSRSNIFFVCAGTLCTPDLGSGCLNGVIRREVLRSAREAGIPYQEGRFKPGMLKRAAESFLTNSLIGIVPLTSVNGQRIGSGKPGPVTRKLMKTYQKSLR